MANTVNWSSVKSKLRGKTLSFATETEAVKALVDAGCPQDEAKACVRDSSLVPDGTITVTSFVVSAGTGKGGVLTGSWEDENGTIVTESFSLNKTRYEEAQKLKKEFMEKYESISIQVSKETTGCSITYGETVGQDSYQKYNIRFSSSADMRSGRRLTPNDVTFETLLKRRSRENLLNLYDESFKTKDVNTITETGEKIILLHRQLSGVKKGLPVL